MAAGLFHRPAREERAADDDQTMTGEARDADSRAATQEHKADADRTEVNPHPRVKAATPVPAGGAVAPITPDPAPTTSIRTGGGSAETAEIDKGELDKATARADRAEADRAAAEEKAASRRWARTSFSATVSLILGTVAVLAALSGRLAPVAIVVGVVGLLFAGAGFAAVSRKHVTGHHVVLIGLLFSLAGIVLGVLALNKTVPWLNADHDQVGQFRDWLNARWASVRS